jgi:DNA-binding CsgD family transcriptional regulator
MTAPSLAQQAEELLARAHGNPDAVDCADLAERVAAARADLAAALRASPAEERCAELVDLGRLEVELRGRVVDLRLQAIGRVHAALAELRACADVSALLPAAAEAFAQSCDLDRGVVSRLRGSSWRGEAVWMRPGLDPELAQVTRDYLTRTWTPLSRGRLETDLIRRRTAEVVVVSDPRTTPPLMAATRSTGYVASPVFASGRVIGFLQGDCQGSGRVLSGHDRDNAWTFAEGFGLVFERAVLLERLEAQRRHVREAFARAEAQLEQTASDEIALSREAPDPSPGVLLDLVRPTEVGVLTAREREVVELMATGARNSEIADKLVIGSETVKTHIRGAMRKLDAATRAEAVSHYLQLAGREGA